MATRTIANPTREPGAQTTGAPVSEETGAPAQFLSYRNRCGVASGRGRPDGAGDDRRTLRVAVGPHSRVGGGVTVPTAPYSTAPRTALRICVVVACRSQLQLTWFRVSAVVPTVAVPAVHV
jgi:hypothetical protein